MGKKHGIMEMCMKDTSLKALCKDGESSLGKLNKVREYIRGSGETGKCMDMDPFSRIMNCNISSVMMD
jgi:hypothetical protein